MSGVEANREPPGPPENHEQYTGIDVGILTYAYGTPVGQFNFSDEGAVGTRATGTLMEVAQVGHYEKLPRRVAEYHGDLRWKRCDFLCLNYYAQEYCFVGLKART